VPRRALRPCPCLQGSDGPVRGGAFPWPHSSDCPLPPSQERHNAAPALQATHDDTARARHAKILSSSHDLSTPIIIGSATARAWASNGPSTALLSCDVGPGPRRKYQNDLVGLPGLACLFLPCRALCAVRRARSAPRWRCCVTASSATMPERYPGETREHGGDATRPNDRSRHPTIRRAQRDDNKNPAVPSADPIKATLRFRAVFSRLPLRWRWVCFLAVIRPRQQAFREPAVRRAVPVRRGGRVQSPMTAQGRGRSPGRIGDRWEVTDEQPVLS